MGKFKDGSEREQMIDLRYGCRISYLATPLLSVAVVVGVKGPDGEMIDVETSSKVVPAVRPN
jgi:hypothetical protein